MSNNMVKRITYQNIDMLETGKKIRNLLESAGYTPWMLQDYLHLSCVQPIYRWYKGLILPSVDHLFMLSQLLQIHMEDFLVKKNEIIAYDIEIQNPQAAQERLLAYCLKLYQQVA